MRSVHLLSLFLLASLSTLGQEKNPYTFGKVSPEDFHKAPYAIDSGAAAVILADAGAAEFDGRTGDLELLTHRYVRAHILKKAGYEAATFEVYLNDDRTDHSDALQHLRGSTYNLENGAVVETKLDPTQVYVTRNKEDHLVRFTMPNVKEGSIIEVSYDCQYYSQNSPAPWYFQGQYPELWSQFTMQVPGFYAFAVLPRGYYKLNVSKKESQGSWRWRQKADLSVSYAAQEENGSVSARVTNYSYTMHNLPALNAESYTSSWRNFASGVEFQLAAVNFGPDESHKHEIIPSWPKLQEELMKRSDYGARLLEDNFYLKEVADKLTAGKKTDREKAAAIFYWMQHTMGRKPENYLLGQTPLKKAFQERKGTSTEINLLLVEMLRAANLDAWPIILSTRDHGFTYADYPLYHQYNYTIAWLNLVEGTAMLDASEPGLAFGQLPLRCYNGHARLMTPDAPAVMLNPDSLQETDVTYVQADLDNEGDLSGTASIMSGYHHALHLRQQGMSSIKENIHAITGLPKEVTVSNIVLDGREDPEAPLTLKADFKLAPEESKPDLIYLTPILAGGESKNPFTRDERLYPVEFGYTQRSNYTANITLPDQYKVESLPKPTYVMLPDSSASFRYVIQQAGNVVQLRVSMVFKKSFFKPDEYDALRGFFDFIVKKEAEQVVLKKQ